MCAVEKHKQTKKYLQNHITKLKGNNFENFFCAYFHIKTKRIFHFLERKQDFGVNSVAICHAIHLSGGECGDGAHFGVHCVGHAVEPVVDF